MEYDDVNHPKHYTKGPQLKPLECIDITRHLSFNMGNAVKYIWRAGKKGDHAKALEDLEKARWYIEEERWRRVVASYPVKEESAPGEVMARVLVESIVQPPLNTLEGRRYEAIRTLLQGLFGQAEGNIAEMEHMIRNDKSNSLL